MQIEAHPTTRRKITGMMNTRMDGVSEVRPNVNTHPEFAKAFEDAKAAGVDILFLTCHVEPDLLVINS